MQDALPEHFVEFSIEEISQAVHYGANRKSVGMDGVPQELLKAIIGIEEGILSLKRFFDKVMEEQLHPQEWCHSLMCLLPKRCSPLVPKDLRPVCLTSHLSKTFSRLITQRIVHKLLPDTPFQCCAPQRQTTDYIWAIQRVMQLSCEWDAPICAVKVAVEKAFDRLDRCALGGLLIQEVGGEFPTEVRNLLAMLRVGAASVPTLWGDGKTEMTIGVRQGGVESATLFGWVITKVLNQLAEKWQATGWLPDGQAEAQAFMDDIIAWDGSTKRLQAKIEELQSLYWVGLDYVSMYKRVHYFVTELWVTLASRLRESG